MRAVQAGAERTAARSGALVRALGAHFARMGKQVMYERETGVGLHRYDVSLPAEGLEFDVAVNSLLRDRAVPGPRAWGRAGPRGQVGRAAGDMEDVGH
jgi:hypothetical protein